MSKQVEPKSTTIQCLLRRKGGTKVPFGHNQATQTVYHFKPIDANEPMSPHVCDVKNPEHIARFLSIPEAYRLYDGSDVVDKIPVTKGADEDESSFKNRFDDILSIDFETADNETVSDWAEEVLGLTTAHHAKIKEKASNLNVTVEKGDNMVELLRKIGKAMQAEEQLASKQAENIK